MKNRVSIILTCVVIAVLGSSCNDYLDINTNPNKATAVQAQLVLPQALAATANSLDVYNTYGSQIGGYAANAGGYGGFNETVSYAYTPNNYAGNWPLAYDNLEDYQYIINQTADDELNIHFHAVAKIMRVYNFQLLVDAYNDVPFTEALQGVAFLTPAYDNAASIYASLATELDDAMTEIVTGNGLVGKNDIDNYDILFGGDMDSWMKLANTIKLRLLIRGNGKVTFANTSFNSIGFLTNDALINPSYTRDNSRQNPAWDTWGFAYTGSAGNKAWIPTTFILTFYDGTKLNDPGRGSAMYFDFPNTGTNQLGYESTGIPKSPDGSFWYPGSERDGKVAGDTTGVLKGPDAGYPMFTAAESYFLQAEASVVGLATPATGTTQELFEAGIEASFKYLYQLPDGSQAGDYEEDAADYIASNNNKLVQFNLALSQAEQIEAIITQKYIALNMVNSHEGWNEYRRTGYPSVFGRGAKTTFASIASQSSRPDFLPSRILYPTS
ncbi:MAG TPA: SusD/RagB family nutrient-binding outer membrane lipoprotein, partial [Chryseolinea sp.]|nr:SusD/RagB family nutrient-binding outer membrane lipoprotein [Chryseolinea sp.]